MLYPLFGKNQFVNNCNSAKVNHYKKNTSVFPFFGRGRFFENDRLKIEVSDT